MNIEDFVIEIRVFEKQRGKLVGNASISFMNPDTNGFRIKGFKVLTDGNFSTGFRDKDDKTLWVAPPAYPDPVSGKLIGMFYMATPLWKVLESKILESFLISKENRTR